MTDGKMRINTILTNYEKGAYTLDYLKNLLAEGKRHLDERGYMNVEISFIKSLAQIEAAVAIIEQGKRKGKEQ